MFQALSFCINTSEEAEKNGATFREDTTGTQAEDRTAADQWQVANRTGYEAGVGVSTATFHPSRWHVSGTRLADSVNDNPKITVTRRNAPVTIA